MFTSGEAFLVSAVVRGNPSFAGMTNPALEAWARENDAALIAKGREAARIAAEQRMAADAAPLGAVAAETQVDMASVEVAAPAAALQLRPAEVTA
jgi:hypothetical protein